MKTFLTIFYVFCLIASFHAQTISYQPMNDSITMWLMNNGYSDTGTPYETQERIIMSGDTLIGGLVYQRVFKGPLNPQSPMLFQLGFREDVATEQRFIFQNGVEDTIEIPFNFSVGEIVLNVSAFKKFFRIQSQEFYLDGADSLLVTGKDSILELNGNYSGTFTFDLFYNGVISPIQFKYNSKRGVIEYSGFEHWEQAYCYRENGEQTAPGQQTPWTYSCDLGWQTNEDITIEVFPNPCINWCQIQTNNSIKRVKIYSNSGILLNDVLVNSKNYQLNVPNSGLYHLNIELENGLTRQKRIVVN